MADQYPLISHHVDIQNINTGIHIFKNAFIIIFFLKGKKPER